MNNPKNRDDDQRSSIAQNQQRARKQPADTAREGGAAYAPHEEGETPQVEKTQLSPAAPGDDRAPADTIGEIAYALGEKKDTGGAGEPETSKLEPEKQGGIGGP